MLIKMGADADKVESLVKLHSNQVKLVFQSQSSTNAPSAYLLPCNRMRAHRCIISCASGQVIAHQPGPCCRV